MIITEYFRTRSDGVVLVRTYSDENRFVVRNNISYAEAIDPEGEHREYTEGDIIPEIL